MPGTLLMMRVAALSKTMAVKRADRADKSVRTDSHTEKLQGRKHTVKSLIVRAF
jgi:hypothetical protein